MLAYSYVPRRTVTVAAMNVCSQLQQHSLDLECCDWKPADPLAAEVEAEDTYRMLVEGLAVAVVSGDWVVRHTRFSSFCLFDLTAAVVVCTT